MKRVVIFGTHPQQYNGYSKVVYELSRRMVADGYEVHVYGFQRLKEPGQHRVDFGATGVKVYDAAANEEPKAHGFGIAQIKAYIAEVRPDVCIVYNDMVVLTSVINQLQQCLKEKESGLKFKIIAYIDQVYAGQRKEYIKFVNEHADAAILFTEGWKDVIRDSGLTVPMHVVEHGFNKSALFPVPKNVARGYFGISPDDFIIMNLNRNQPRKRWDTCVMAFAELVARYPNEPIKLLIAAAPKGAWDIMDVYERELKKNGVSVDDGTKRLIVVDRPQAMSDFDINVLYNVADVGINTCDGEGFGLCNFEQAGVGIPQIVPALGGFKDIFDESTAEMVQPKLSVYIDSSRDSVLGEAKLCDPMDFVAAVERLYFNRDRMRAVSELCRKQIASSERFDWDVLARRLGGIVEEVCGGPEPEPDSALEKEEEPIIVSTVQKDDLYKELQSLQKQLALLTAKLMI